MTDQTIDERIAARKAAEEELRTNLLRCNLDGPYEFPSGGMFGDPLGDLFGAARRRFAICLDCGSLVVLDDPETLDDGQVIERGVRLHTAWHGRVKTR